MAELKDLFGPKGTLRLYGNPWLEPMREKVSLGKHHILEYVVETFHVMLCGILFDKNHPFYDFTIVN